PKHRSLGSKALDAVCTSSAEESPKVRHGSWWIVKCFITSAMTKQHLAKDKKADVRQAQVSLKCLHTNSFSGSLLQTTPGKKRAGRRRNTGNGVPLSRQV